MSRWMGTLPHTHSSQHWCTGNDVFAPPLAYTKHWCIVFAKQQLMASTHREDALLAPDWQWLIKRAWVALCWSLCGGTGAVVGKPRDAGALGCLLWSPRRCQPLPCLCPSSRDSEKST